MLWRSPARGASVLIFERPGVAEIKAWLWARYIGADELTYLARAAFEKHDAVDIALSGAGVLHAHVKGVLAWLVDQGVTVPTRGETT
ncbi:hypothetical protein CPT_Sansa15 [Caulobacter phage Sansa]|uniref:Uncharacterized protein n=1 Tax=Caulobacter phage Sansa TaxID=1675600 RepID=A0A0K1LLU4_9CAUD|nr:hypothetical protein HOR07_gp015 [Caulobacter phage Sansa]AKU43419.1 hypothetical protein CPT_Sansa15 [Caulobacter phage Sansa]